MTAPIDTSLITQSEIKSFLSRTQWAGAAPVADAMAPGAERPQRRKLINRINYAHNAMKKKAAKPGADAEALLDPQREIRTLPTPIGFNREPEPPPLLIPPEKLADTAAMSRIQYLEWQVGTLTVQQATAKAGSVAAVQVARELSQRHAELSALRTEERKATGADLDDMDDHTWEVHLAEQAQKMAIGDLEPFVERYTALTHLRLVPDEDA